MATFDIAATKKAIEEATDALKKCTDQIHRARTLLREWRDKYGGREHHRFPSIYGGMATASPTDLLRETQRFLEGK